MGMIWNRSLPFTKRYNYATLLRLAKRLSAPLLNSLQRWKWPVDTIRKQIPTLKLNDPPSAVIHPLVSEFFEVSNADGLYDQARDYLTGYLSTKTPQELIEMARRKGVSPAFLHWSSYYNDYKALVEDNGKEFQSIYRKHKKDQYFGIYLPPNDAWKLFADSGDADAMELYAK